MVNIRQDKGESLRMFMERFGRVTLNILDLSPEDVLHHMVIAQRPSLLANYLCKRTTIRMDELW